MATENVVLLLIAAALGGLHVAGGPLSGAFRAGKKRRAAGLTGQGESRPPLDATVDQEASGACSASSGPVNRAARLGDESSPEIAAQ